MATLLVAQGHEVTRLTRSAADVVPPDVQRLTGGLRKSRALARAITGVDGVCHLAGLTKLTRITDRSTRLLTHQPRKTLTTLDALTSGPARRVVLASTCAVYDNQTAQPSP